MLTSVGTEALLRHLIHASQTAGGGVTNEVLRDGEADRAPDNPLVCTRGDEADDVAIIDEQKRTDMQPTAEKQPKSPALDRMGSARSANCHPLLSAPAPHC